MIRINLLPAKVRKTRDTTRQFIAAYGLSIVIAVGGIGYVWNSMKNEKERLDRRIVQLDRETQQYAKYDRMLKELTSKKEIIEKKTEVIQTLQRDRDTIVRALAALSVELPVDKMWFERLTQSGNTITLDGTALNNESIVEFMRNLESSPMVEKGTVNLTHSRRVTVKDIVLKEATAKAVIGKEVTVGGVSVKASRDIYLREFRISYRFLSFSQIQARSQQ